MSDVNDVNDNVIPLRAVNSPSEPKDTAPRIYICQCGCSTYELWEDNTLHCALCRAEHTMADGGGWYKNDVPTALYEGDAPLRSVQGNGSEDFARHVAAKRAESPDAVAIIVIREDGSVHAWSSAETEERMAWVGRRVADAMNLLERKGD